MVVPARAQTFRVLYEFTGAEDGGYPVAGLVRDPRGSLYGTTSSGGVPGSCLGNLCGVVFKLDRDGKQSVLHSFDFTGNGWDGAHPQGTLVRDPQGNLYGTTIFGGTGPCFDPATDFRVGCGMVFKLDRDGNETVLYNFVGDVDDANDGGGIAAGLLRDERGNLYGTTMFGGTGACVDPPTRFVIGCGTVFKLDRDGKETVLYRFTGGVDGAKPFAALIRDEHGNLYGTALLGGSYGAGTVFKLTPE